MSRDIIFFIDVDNTLIDNDRLKEEIRTSLIKVLGEQETSHFWKYHDSFRDYKKYVDFPNIIRGYCKENHKKTCNIKLQNIFYAIDFKKAIFPRVKEVLSHLNNVGDVNLFTEGDTKYQRMKVDRSGLSEMASKVFLFEHKLDHVKEIINEYHDSNIIFIDDRAEILRKIKEISNSTTTIEVCQGHYAKERHQDDRIDKSVKSITELVTLYPN